MIWKSICCQIFEVLFVTTPVTLLSVSCLCSPGEANVATLIHDWQMGHIVKDSVFHAVTEI
jgi:hypothetical protein